MTRPHTEADFWQRVDKSAGPDGCWPWTGSGTMHGYGKWGNTTAHRAAWQYATRTVLARSEFVLHNCDNPPCCNPSHLRRGTPADNMADMLTKGRDRRHNPKLGSSNGIAKLTEAQVVEMRQLASEGVLTSVLATRYGVSRSRVSEIIRRRAWTHV